MGNPAANGFGKCLFLAGVLGIANSLMAAAPPIRLAQGPFAPRPAAFAAQDPFGAQEATAEEREAEDVAEGGADEQKADPLAKLRGEIEAMEAEIKSEVATRRERIEAEQALVEKYRQDLVAEYGELEKRRQQLTGSTTKIGLVEARGTEFDELQNQQKRIAIRYGELFRFEQLLVAAGESFDLLQERIHRFVAEKEQELQQIQGGRDSQELRRQLHSLTQKTHEMRMQQMRRQTRRSDIHSAMNRGFVDYTREIREKLQLPKLGSDPGAATTEEVREFGAINEPLAHMFRLAWQGEHVGLDKAHWDELFGGEDLESLRQSVRRKLAADGVKFEEIDIMAQRYRAPSPSKLAMLAQNLQHWISEADYGDTRSQQQSSQEHSWLHEFSREGMRFRIQVTPGIVHFELAQMVAPVQTLTIRAYDSGQLQISVVGDDLFWLNQSADGTVQVAETFEQEMLHRKADSMLALYVAHPDYLEGNVFPRLRQLGILPPPTRFDASVIQQVLQELDAEVRGATAPLDELLRQLDSDEFQVRTAAARAIEDALPRYAERLEEKYRDDSLPFEVRARIQRMLRSEAAKRDVGTALVDSLELTSNAHYLVEILPHVDELAQLLVMGRLETITGATPGTTVAAWQAWRQQP